jgi:CP family cyanate transporter-like MFS transporter
MTSRRTPLWVGAALLLVALNLRLPIAGIGPVLDDIRATLGLSSTAAGLLTTLPLLCFGGAAAAAPAVARRLGPEGGLLACLGFVIAGTAVRLVVEVAPFFLGTLLIGVGIAVANVLVPIVIKRDYPRPGTMMGLYTMVLISGAALAAGLSVPLERAVGSWWDAIALWGIAAVVAFGLWVPAVLAARGEHDGPRPPRVRLRGDRLAWAVTVTFGLQSLLFYVTLAWGPDILRAAGLDAGDAGAMLSLEALVGIPAGLAAPMIAMRMADQRPMIVLSVVFWLLGWGGLLAAPGSAPAVWMVLLGVAQGTSFALALTLIVLRAPDAPHATSLSGMAQGFGYLLAASGPFLAGALHDLTGGWDATLVAMLVLSVALLACGLPAARRGFVRGRPEPDEQPAY